MLGYAFYESDARIKQYVQLLVVKGFQVDVIGLGKKSQKQASALRDVKVYELQGRSSEKEGAFAYLARVTLFLARSSFCLIYLHLRHAYKIIHVHNMPDFLVIAAIIPRLLGAKVILDFHDLMPELATKRFNVGKRSALVAILSYVERVCVLLSDHVLVSNDIWRKRLVSRSVTARKCTAFLNYPDPAIFHKMDVNKNETRFLLLYPGTLSEHQGLDVAIKAVGLLESKIPNIELHIYGTGIGKGRLISLAHRLGLQDKVLFKKFLPLNQIARRMAQADVGIAPKRAEGFSDEALSMKILQFMALGVPVVASRTTTHSFYFNDSLVTFFEPDKEHDLAECILRLFEDEELRSKKVEKALLYVRANNLNKKASIYLDLIDTLSR